jgi:hypothetical protein
VAMPTSAAATERHFPLGDGRVDRDGRICSVSVGLQTRPLRAVSEQQNSHADLTPRVSQAPTS